MKSQLKNKILSNIQEKSTEEHNTEFKKLVKKAKNNKSSKEYIAATKMAKDISGLDFDTALKGIVAGLKNGNLNSKAKKYLKEDNEYFNQLSEMKDKDVDSILKKLSENLNEKVKYPKGFEKFIDLAKKSKSGKEFANQAVKLKNVSFDVQVWFTNKYDPSGGGLNMLSASEKFVKDVHAGIYENELSESIDSDELVLFADNDFNLYRQSTVPIQKNLSKKWKAGKYDHKLAIKLWMNHANRAAKAYAKEFASASEWNTIFSVKDRKEAAKEFADNWKDELEAGNLHEEKRNENKTTNKGNAN